MSNPLKLVEVYSTHSSKDKIITRKEKLFEDSTYLTDIALAVLTIVTEDFNPLKNINNILYDTYSFQIRPKALYKTTRGIFFKDGSERRYLSTQEIIDLKFENNELGKFL